LIKLTQPMFWRKEAHICGSWPTSQPQN